MKTALVIIDIQNDYFKGGKAELYHTEEAARNAKKVLEHFRKQGLPVFHVQHIDESDNAGFFKHDTEGAMINQIVQPIDGEKVVVKHVANAFHDTILNDELNKLGIEHLVICGMMSHMCIDTSVRAAADLNYKVSLVKDACTTMDLSFEGKKIPAAMVHEVFMTSLEGVFASEYNTEDIIDIIK